MSTITPEVAAIAQINFEGNIIPRSWRKHLRYKNGLVHLPAITVLSEIVYWYRPSTEESESGKLMYRRKFKGQLLQKSYAQIAEATGLSKRQARDACKFLAEAGLIELELEKLVITQQGDRLGNVLYIRVFPEAIKRITFTGIEVETEDDTPPSALQRHSSDATASELSPYSVRAMASQRHTYTKINSKTTSKISPEGEEIFEVDLTPEGVVEVESSEIFSNGLSPEKNLRAFSVEEEEVEEANRLVAENRKEAKRILSLVKGRFNSTHRRLAEQHPKATVQALKELAELIEDNETTSAESAEKRLTDRIQFYARIGRYSPQPKEKAESTPKDKSTPPKNDQEDASKEFDHIPLPNMTQIHALGDPSPVSVDSNELKELAAGAAIYLRCQDDAEGRPQLPLVQFLEDRPELNRRKVRVVHNGVITTFGDAVRASGNYSAFLPPNQPTKQAKLKESIFG
jgi:hypothetical protein